MEKKWGMGTSCEKFVEQFKFGLVQVVYEWAKGMPFNEITGLTDVQEGKLQPLMWQETLKRIIDHASLTQTSKVVWSSVALYCTDPANNPSMLACLALSLRKWLN